MKILVVGPICSPIISRLVRHLKDAGNEVLIASFDAESQDGVLNLGKLSSYLNYFNFFKIRKIVRLFNPDLVHAHIVNHYGLMCLFQPRPLVVALWGSDVMLAPHQGNFLKKRIYQLINFAVLKKATRCHTSGHHVAEEANRQYGKSSSKTDVFYWGFPIDKPSESNLKLAAARMEKEFGMTQGNYLVFPRGLGEIYNPEAVAKIINKLIIEVVEPKRVVVLKGFSSVFDENRFKERVDTSSIIYVNRILNSDELYYLYSKTSIHFSIPHSDSLGGGVVEPALFGSFPVLSNIPSYVRYSEKHISYILRDYSDVSLRDLCELIRLKKIYHSPANVPFEYALTNVVEKILNIYKQALVKH